MPRASAGAFAGAVAAVWLMAGAALAAPAFSLERATSAPADIAGMVQYAMQQEDTTDTGGGPGVEGPLTEPRPTTGTSSGQGSTTQGSTTNPVFALPDSTAHRDSLSGFPRNFPARAETIAPLPAYSPSTPAAGGAKPPAPAKRPLFGLSSIALVVGLVALHILVVSWVSK